jgi:hypothetical protein
MKRFIVLAIIVAASLTAFPQVTRTERTSKNGKTKVKKENVEKTTENSEKKTGVARGTSTQNAARTKTEATTQSGNTNARRAVSNPVRQTGQQQATRPVGRSVNATEKGGATRTTMDVNPVRHQNDEVFTKSRYRVDYENTEDLRKSEDFRRNYDEYNNWRNVRVVRRPGNYARYRPVPVEIRRERYVYRQPNHYELVWTPYLFNRFVFYYPGHDRWNIELGREIGTISAYDVLDYVGSVQRVYGKVDEVYYSREDGNYILYIGAPFPYHDMSVVIPRSVCREITVSPEWYFRDQYIWFIGLIDLWEEKPEVVIRDEEQIRRY